MTQDNVEKDLQNRLSQLSNNETMPHDMKKRIVKTLQNESLKNKRRRRFLPITTKMKWAALSIVAVFLVAIAVMSLSQNLSSEQRQYSSSKSLENSAADQSQSSNAVKSDAEHSSEHSDKLYSKKADQNNNSDQGNSGSAGQQTKMGQQEPRSVMVDPLAMVDEQNGWMLTNHTLEKTTDGGKHWIDMTPDGVNINNDHTQDPKPLILNRDDVWLFIPSKSGITVYINQDAGKSWETADIKTEEPVVSIIGAQFTDTDHGFVFVSYGTAAGSEHGAIFKTVDGGSIWKKLTMSDQEQDKGGIPSSGLKSGMTFMSENSGWITGIDYHDEPYLYRTTDGGVNWIRQNLKIPSGFTAEAGSGQTSPPIFFNKKDGLLPVHFGNDGRPMIFYRTEDGGNTWVPTDAVSASDDRGIKDWDFVDKNHGFAVGGKFLFKTVDNAEHWYSIKLARPFEKVDFVTTQVGYGVSDDSLLKTDNGGRTWEVIGSIK